MNSKKPVPDNEIEENLCKIVDKVRAKINDRVIELCHTYPTIMKLGTIISYLKKTQKYMNHVTHLLSSAGISIFSSEIGKFCYIKKYRYELHFGI